MFVGLRSSKLSDDSSLDRRNEFSGDTFTKTSALRDTGNVVSWGRLCPCICYIKIYGCGFNENLSLGILYRPAEIRLATQMLSAHRERAIQT